MNHEAVTCVTFHLHRHQEQMMSIEGVGGYDVQLEERSYRTQNDCTFSIDDQRRYQ